MGSEHDAARASMDLYAVLGVPQDVTNDDLKRVYRRLALKHHPDKNPNDEVAQRKFQEISRAYSILSDPKKKKFYDDNGTIEDIDMSVQDFAAVFQDLVGEMFGDFAIKEVLCDMSAAELRSLPPFPFPKELFPPGTFPEGLRFSSEGLQGVPPAVEELLEQGNLEALAGLFAPPPPPSHARGMRCDSDSDWEEASSEDMEACPDTTPSQPRQRHSARRAKRWDQRQQLPASCLEEMLLSMAMDTSDGGAAGSPLDAFLASGAMPDEGAMLAAVAHLLDPSSQPAKPGAAGSKGGRVVKNGGTNKRPPSQSSSSSPQSTAAAPAPAAGAKRPPSARAVHSAPCAGGASAAAAEDATHTMHQEHARAGPPLTTPKTATSSLSSPPTARLHSHSSSTTRSSPLSPPPTPAAVPPSTALSRPPRPLSTTLPASPGPHRPPTRPEVKAWMDAAKSCEVAVMHPLLQATPALLNACGTGVGHTALHWCCARGSEAAVQWLLSCGADPAARNSEGSTPLHAAARNGQQQCAELLLAAGGRVLVGAVDDEGRVAAQAAAEGDHHALAALLAAVASNGAAAALQPPELPHMQPPELPHMQPPELPPQGPQGSSTVQHGGSSAAYGGLLSVPPTAAAEAAAPAAAAAAAAAPAGHAAIQSSPLPCPHHKAASSSSPTEYSTSASDTPRQATRPTSPPAVPSGTPSPGPHTTPSPSAPPPPDTYAPPLPPASASCPHQPLSVPVAALDTSSHLPAPRSPGNSSNSHHPAFPPACQPLPTSQPPSVQPPPPLQPSLPVTNTPLPAPSCAAQSLPPNAAPALPQSPPPAPAPTPTSSSHAPKPRTADDKAELRRRLLAEDEAAERQEEHRAQRRGDAAVEAGAAVGVGLQEGRAWMDAAKAGRVAELRRMAGGNALLLGYRGQGTSYGFCGHTALHWAAAKGHVEAVRWLLRSGADVDARNFAGSTPLHTAVGNEQEAAARVLLLEGCAEAHASDELGETPKDVALRKGLGPLAASIDSWGKVAALRRVEASTWTARAMRTLLLLWGVDSSGAVEKQDLRDLCDQVLSQQPPQIRADPSSLASIQRAQGALAQQRAAATRDPHPGPTSASWTPGTAAPIPGGAEATCPQPLTHPDSARSHADATTSGAAPAAHAAAVAAVADDAAAGDASQQPRPGRSNGTRTEPSAPAQPAVVPALTSSSVPGRCPPLETGGGGSSSMGDEGHLPTPPASSGAAIGSPPGLPSAAHTSSGSKAAARAAAPLPSSSDSRGGGGGGGGGSPEEQLAEAAKARGNDAFRKGDYSRAIVQYSMAIRLQRGSAVLHSNRSAAYAAAGRWEEALEDAQTAAVLEPAWGKAWCRKGAALLGLGQGGEAVKAFQQALRVEPGSEQGARGLQEAREVIWQHQQRYQEMWGRE